MQYSDYMNRSVCNGTKEIKDSKYIDVGKEPFLIKESDLDRYREYGGGFRSLKFIGNIETA